jgi:CRP-like cAMP-binding protein
VLNIYAGSTAKGWEDLALHDGNEIHNEILLGLPRNECNLLFSNIELVKLRSFQLLYEVGDSIRSCYFCDSGMVSTLSVFPDGKSMEVGLLGKEGFVGLPLLAGFRTSPARINVQISGSAFRVDADTLSDSLTCCPTLALRLNQFSQIVTMQIRQIAACNGLHCVEERLARWLLMAADRTGEHRLPLRQEMLAQMLGNRRASVNLAALQLRKAGAIRYSRAEVEIINRKRLEEIACVCYDTINRQTETWRHESM